MHGIKTCNIRTNWYIRNAGICNKLNIIARSYDALLAMI